MPNLKDFAWHQTYATSDVRADGAPVDVLHDFYIPVLSRSTQYDRVAGYFTSTSLAAASQGFSRFVENGGKARFIVGMELAVQDAEAILTGNDKRMRDHLLAELSGSAEWPSGVRSGVELLSWMIIRGLLEIQVGLRVHARKATPQAFNFGGDGYLHEKWAIFGDGANRLFISGSLNESLTALAVNAENITLHPSWSGEWNQVIIREKLANFEQMWRHDHPYIRTYTVPDAVRKRLLKIVSMSPGITEIDGTPTQLDPIPPMMAEPIPGREVEGPTAGEKLRFAIIRLAPLLRGGEWVGMDTAPVEPWPHQRFVARRIIESFPENHLLCDEVGLGKTIEAGLAFRSLWLSGRACSIRVFAPAALTDQWMREMALKFLMPFDRRVSRSGKTERVNLATGQVDELQGRIFDSPLEVISTGLLVNSRSGALLREMPETDLALVDEAHKARRQNPDDRTREGTFNKLYRQLRDGLYPKVRSLLLATATPMQINRVEAFDLLRFMPTAGTVQLSDDLCDIFYQIRNKITDGEAFKRYEVEWLRRYLRNVRQSAPEQWAFVHQRVLDRRTRADLDLFIDHGSEPFDWQDLRVGLTMLAPMGRSMLRHGRSLLREYQQAGLLNAKLAYRHVRPRIIPLVTAEREVYDELQSYCADLAEHIAANMEDGKQRAAIGFYLSFLRLRFASSFHALRESLVRRRAKVQLTLEHQEALEPDWDEEELEGLSEGDVSEYEALVLKNRQPADLLWELGAVDRLLAIMERLPAIPSKTQVLLDDIQSRRVTGTHRVRQMVVFTRYADTMDYLHDELCRRLRDAPIGTFSGRGGTVRRVGALTPELLDRTNVKQSFLAGGIDILICTDAAAEGLNLQTADLLVNFDLPWNPMLLEQRIGRIDRIGQKYDKIAVSNYLYQGSVEEIVYVRLFRRFNQALNITGELSFSVLPISEEDFSRLARTDVEEGKLTEEDLIAQAETRANQIRERQRLTQFDAKSQKDAYEALEEELGRATPSVTLEFIWSSLVESPYLKSLGCEVESFEHGNALLLNGIASVPPQVLLTTSRELLEHGLPRGDHRALHFASYGDPVFENLLSHLLNDEEEVVTAWNRREAVESLQVENEVVRGPGTLPHAEFKSDAHITVRQRAQSARAAAHSRNPLGQLQRDIVVAVSAALAEKKLSSSPDTPSNQIRRLDRFLTDVSRRSTPEAELVADIPNRAAVEAREEQLLWAFRRRGQSLLPILDPLLIETSIHMIERSLQSVPSERRHGTGISSFLRSQLR